MNRIMEKINFKKVAIIYFVLLLITIIGIMFLLGNKYYDKLTFLYHYHNIGEILEEKDSNNILEKELSILDSQSDDVVGASIIKDGKIIFSTSDKFKNDLVKVDNTKNVFKSQDEEIYLLNKKDDFILSLLGFENEENYYDEFNLRKDYIFNYLNNESEQVVIIAKAIPIDNNHFYLKLSISVLIMFFMLYLVITSLIIYQNALKLKLNAYFWAIAVLFTNIVGVIIYIIYSKRRINCSKCGVSLMKNVAYCPYCGSQVNKVCKKCHQVIQNNDKYCKSCGEKL